jgi:hypothetical protein
LHNGELQNLSSSPDIIRQTKSRKIKWAGHVARIEEERKVYRVWVGKPEGKSPLGRRGRRWESGIRMDLREMGWGWSGLSWLRNGTGGCFSECGDEPSGSGATELVKECVMNISTSFIY